MNRRLACHSLQVRFRVKLHLLTKIASKMKFFIALLVAVIATVSCNPYGTSSYNQGGSSLSHGGSSRQLSGHNSIKPQGSSFDQHGLNQQSHHGGSGSSLSSGRGHGGLSQGGFSQGSKLGNSGLGQSGYSSGHQTAGFHPGGSSQIGSGSHGLGSGGHGSHNSHNSYGSGQYRQNQHY